MSQVLWKSEDYLNLYMSTFFRKVHDLDYACHVQVNKNFQKMKSTEDEISQPWEKHHEIFIFSYGKYLSLFLFLNNT